MINLLTCPWDWAVLLLKHIKYFYCFITVGAAKFLILTNRYCVNSASLEFQAATTSEGEAAVEEAPLITHTATLGGCGGVDGVCKRPPKPNKETSVN